MSGLEERILIIVKDLEEEKRLADKRTKQLYLAGASFIGHDDTPAAYAGQAGKFIKVNATPDALIFADLAAGDLPAHASFHHSGGADPLAFASIAGFGTYLDQAVKIASNPQFAGVKLGGTTYYLGSGAAASKLYTLYVNEIWADVGAIGDPSYTFDGDKDTGMFQAGANILAFTCGGVERLRMAASYVRLPDNHTLRLGTGNDFRMWHDGSHHYFRSYKHGVNLYIQGENAGGTNKSLMMFDPDIPGVLAYDHGAAATDQIVNVCYGTGSPPTASTTTIGTIFLKYT